MSYKLVALDIDGTIRSVERPITERTRQAIARVSEAGTVVTLATGRIFQSARASSSDLNLKSPIVSFQGAHVAFPCSGEVLWHRPLTRELIAEALDALRGWDVQTVAYHEDQIFVQETTEWVEAYAVRNQVKLNLVDDLTSRDVPEATRLVAVGDESHIEHLERDIDRTDYYDLMDAVSTDEEE